MEHLSNIELYFSQNVDLQNKSIELTDEEFHHAVNVMRNKKGAKLFVTDGNGKIYYGDLESIGKNSVKVNIAGIKKFQNHLKNVKFFLPVLKNPERIKFAIEKSVELGITDLVLFTSKRGVRKLISLERFNKIALAAMKQSLRAYLPVIKLQKELDQFSFNEEEIILFEQNSEMKLRDLNFVRDKKYCFIFGPEGGLDELEIKFIKKKYFVNLAANRLRTETAVLKAATIISEKFE